MGLRSRLEVANSFTHTSSIHDSNQRKYTTPIHLLITAM